MEDGSGKGTGPPPTLGVLALSLTSKMGAGLRRRYHVDERLVKGGSCFWAFALASTLSLSFFSCVIWS
ncbi:hypothetical protein DL95DRAFT_175053 [Leptodontidium sp. 2 PMI_412]|nr:hypothetical protein DL95DRAFT_175053 [Leptodontidium sp. 2 PMI_412]